MCSKWIITLRKGVKHWNGSQELCLLSIYDGLITGWKNDRRSLIAYDLPPSNDIRFGDQSHAGRAPQFCAFFGMAKDQHQLSPTLKYLNITLTYLVCNQLEYVENSECIK